MKDKLKALINSVDTYNDHAEFRSDNQHREIWYECTSQHIKWCMKRQSLGRTVYVNDSNIKKMTSKLLQLMSKKLMKVMKALTAYLIIISSQFKNTQHDKDYDKI